MEKKSDNVIIVLKFIAVLLITNSHFEPVYPPALSRLATFGAIGNALFFFLSGYALSLGRLDGYGVWLKRRLLRIIPSAFIWCLVSALIWGKEITLSSLIGFNYWFIECIVIYYFFYYWILKYCREYLLWLVALSLAVCCVYFFISPVQNREPIYGPLCYVIYLGIMLIGTYFGIHREAFIVGLSKRYSAWLYLFAAFLCIPLFYLIQIFGIKDNGLMYYLQITSVIPLYLFVVSLYFFFRSISLDRMLSNPRVFAAVTTIGGLTLQAYIVQFALITSYAREFFPLNLIVTFLVIFAVAYILKKLNDWLIVLINSK